MNSMLSENILSRIEENVAKVMIGKKEVTRRLLAAVAAGGHVLLEDVPGTGKTVLAKALAKSMGCKFDRVQFTPDLLPSDVTGLSFFNQEKAAFTFNAVKPSGMYGGRPGDRGRRDADAGASFLCNCHAESCGDDRLLSPSRSAA